jgi:hypothetical protein
MGSLAVQRYRDARGVGKGLAATAAEAGIGDLSGMHRIDPDVPSRELQDYGFCQVAKPPFASRVGSVVMRGQSGGRGNVTIELPPLSRIAGAQCWTAVRTGST